MLIEPGYSLDLALKQLGLFLNFSLHPKCHWKARPLSAHQLINPLVVPWPRLELVFSHPSLVGG